MPRKKKGPEKENQPLNNGGNGVTEDGSALEKPATRKRAPRKRLKSAAKVEPAAPQISDEAVRLRAYFIAEERARRGLPGDQHSDWVEARRQLMAELG
jgi:Protein of unknown function (DUF2934)